MSNPEQTSGKIRVEHFVREALGCTCPDDVFKHIRQPDPRAVFASAYAVYEIGGRLCVAVFVPDNWRDLAQQLGQLVADGMHYRDQHGFNRLRLVIACSDGDAVNRLSRAFDALPNLDDKVHLHVVPPSQLPFDVSAQPA